ncbi:PIG-L family deacetylase [Brevibacterium sp. SMBL_HHYL_HB1]|uniref:PIG-L family deacetylase n=1 Tax=Brevibacterium sp. SMBL_HHYL_HB1 TaxID=2777556 RepID=UPI0020128E49|nr:PIG-L family deacetylase [Brevibacterium sp. SMBL_HHYL_HB1]
MSMRFSHQDRSTREDAWVQAGALDLPAVPESTIATGGTIIVLAAHPDDEALGAAALLARADEWSCQLKVLLFSAGEKSHPESPTYTGDQLKSIRLEEFDRALSTFDKAHSSRFLDLPDGQLPEYSSQIRDVIRQEIARSHGPVTLVAPYSRDGHCDHEAVGAASLDIGRSHHAVVLEYPIWFWHWAVPTDPRWQAWAVLPAPQGLDRNALLQCYPSQTEALSDQQGDEAILTSAHLEHFIRSHDTFVITDFRSGEASAGYGQEGIGRPINDASTASAVFDDVHRERSDPWTVWESEYEITKRETLVSHLPSTSFSHILEIGCSVGALTRELAAYSVRVTAVDASCEALKTAKRLQTTTATEIAFLHATVPYEWPEGHFDCVVLSETGFYLTRAQLQRTLERIDESTPSRFVLVLCHWKGDIEDWPLTADEVHDACLDYWPRLRSDFRSEAEYRLDIVTVDKTDDFLPAEAVE